MPSSACPTERRNIFVSWYKWHRWHGTVSDQNAFGQRESHHDSSESHRDNSPPDIAGDTLDTFDIPDD